MPFFTFERIPVGHALAEASAIAVRYTGQSVTGASMCASQGQYSRTVEVTLGDSSKLIVQFRDDDIDTSIVALARALVGAIVPTVNLVYTRLCRRAYVSQYAEGTLWGDRGICAVDDDKRVASEIGALVARLQLSMSSASVVEDFIIPRLQQIIRQTPFFGNQDLAEKVRDIAARAHRLKSLPLAVCHTDINRENIILKDDFTVNALIDWERAAILPLGMGAWCIHQLAVMNIKGVDYETADSRKTVVSFREAFYSNVPTDFRTGEGAETLLLAMQIGYILSIYIEDMEAARPEWVASLLPRLKWLETSMSCQPSV
ncbi:hypothetical protein PENSPDRAFT_49547 [Peniophora sp. CONT]|nr:hypothetical protein PENSPDRAFT_49547 [Peniophora sp. CONT]